jgi:hypothetical protein
MFPSIHVIDQLGSLLSDELSSRTNVWDNGGKKGGKGSKGKRRASHAKRPSRALSDRRSESSGSSDSDSDSDGRSETTAASGGHHSSEDSDGSGGDGRGTGDPRQQAKAKRAVSRMRRASQQARMRGMMHMQSDALSAVQAQLSPLAAQTSRVTAFNGAGVTGNETPAGHVPKRSEMPILQRLMKLESQMREVRDTSASANATPYSEAGSAGPTLRSPKASNVSWFHA